MAQQTTEYYCINCRKKLSEKIIICPNCGSNARNIVLKIKEEIGVHDQIKGKMKENGIKKPTHEFIRGDDLHRKSGKWSSKERDINRKNNFYKEIIKDKMTGEIIRKCEEPLSQHKGYGSARER